MQIIAQDQEINNINQVKGFWLHFYLKGDGSEFLDLKLPIPSYLEHYGGSGGYAIAWLIDGYFGTTPGTNFLNDVIARFLISFADLSPQRLPYKPTIEKDNKTAHILSKAYSLKSFSTRLKSLPTKRKKIPLRTDSFEDVVFWAIKLYAEDAIRNIGIIPSKEYLEDFAYSQFINNIDTEKIKSKRREKSTLKSKCRNIYEYYEKLDFELPKRKRRSIMSRTDHITKVNKERAEKKERAILNLISGMFAEDYKFKTSKKWNVAKISKELGMSKDTVKKYLPI